MLSDSLVVNRESLVEKPGYAVSGGHLTVHGSRFTVHEPMVHDSLPIWFNPAL